MSEEVIKAAAKEPSRLDVYYNKMPAYLLRRDSSQLRFKLFDAKTGQSIGGWGHVSLRKLEDPNLVTEEEHKKSITSAA